jgi:hypothetical protein
MVVVVARGELIKVDCVRLALALCEVGATTPVTNYLSI